MFRFDLLGVALARVPAACKFGTTAGRGASDYSHLRLKSEAVVVGTMLLKQLAALTVLCSTVAAPAAALRSMASQIAELDQRVAAGLPTYHQTQATDALEHGEGSEWYAAHPYTVKLTIRERAFGMTLGATLATHAEVISRACSYL